MNNNKRHSEHYKLRRNYNVFFFKFIIKFQYLTEPSCLLKLYGNSKKIKTSFVTHNMQIDCSPTGE